MEEDILTSTGVFQALARVELSTVGGADVFALGGAGVQESEGREGGDGLVVAVQEVAEVRGGREGEGEDLMAGVWAAVGREGYQRRWIVAGELGDWRGGEVGQCGGIIADSGNIEERSSICGDAGVGNVSGIAGIERVDSAGS